MYSVDPFVYLGEETDSAPFCFLFSRLSTRRSFSLDIELTDEIPLENFVSSRWDKGLWNWWVYLAAYAFYFAYLSYFLYPFEWKESRFHLLISEKHLWCSLDKNLILLKLLLTVHWSFASIAGCLLLFPHVCWSFFVSLILESMLQN